MNKLLYFFAFYVLALAVWPCCDDVKEYDSQKTFITESSNGCDSDSEKEICSPFFHCGNCQAFTLTVKTSLLKYIPYFKKINIPRTKIAESNYLVSVWQPPKYC